MLGAIAGAVLGGIAGSQGNSVRNNGSSSSSVQLRDINDLNKGRSDLEALGVNQSMNQFNDLVSLVGAGPGASAITDSLTASNDYATMLQNMIAGGGAPSTSQLSSAQNYAQQVFAPQQTALNQQFDDQRIQSQRLAARLGRPGNDPILANKLMQEQTRQQTMLNSQQGAFGAQYADQLQGRQLDLGQSLMNVRNGLASQAFANRQSLLTLGQQLVSSERNYRTGTATKNINESSTQTSGGGVAGGISGALAGFGAGASAFAGAPSWSSMFSSAPAATPNVSTNSRVPVMTPGSY